jgi:hypothetical protein
MFHILKKNGSNKIEKAPNELTTINKINENLYIEPISGL